MTARELALNASCKSTMARLQRETYRRERALMVALIPLWVDAIFEGQKDQPPTQQTPAKSPG